RRNPEARNCAERAERIARLAGVSLVLMGHTHTVDHREIDGGRATYANSGTWTAVGNPWSRLMRDARRLTFLHVRGDRVELARWNDDAGRIDEVPLFSDEQVEG
ncbi:MAG TPA: metallophosphoesterase family protein, partial [Polyangia bacterium]|nr:metallophosphoesterase family protein [Polyangia bacterium]